MTCCCVEQGWRQWGLKGVPLTPEHHGFELRRSTHKWIYFNDLMETFF